MKDGFEDILKLGEYSLKEVWDNTLSILCCIKTEKFIYKLVEYQNVRT